MTPEIADRLLSPAPPAGPRVERAAGVGKTEAPAAALGTAAPVGAEPVIPAPVHRTPRPGAARPTAEISPDAPARPGRDRADEATPTGRGSRRERVIDGAAQVFAEYGYHGASLRHIAAHVEITHPGLLHHFASKEDLLDAVVDRMEAHAQDALDRIDELAADAESFGRALAEMWDPCSAPIQLLATLDADVVSHDHPGRYRIARLHRVHEHVLEQCVARLARSGELCQGVEPAFAARSLLSLVLSLALREKTVRTMQRQTHDDAPLTDLHELAGFFLRGRPDGA